MAIVSDDISDILQLYIYLISIYLIYILPHFPLSIVVSFILSVSFSSEMFSKGSPYGGLRRKSCQSSVNQTHLS